MKYLRPKLILSLCLLCGAVALILFLIPEPPPAIGIEWITAPPPAPKSARTPGTGWKSQVTAKIERARRWLFGDPPLLVSVVVYETYPSTLLWELPAGAVGFTNGSGARAFVIRDGQALRDRLKSQTSQLIMGPTTPIPLRQGEQRQIANAHTVWIGGWSPQWLAMPGEVRTNSSTNPYTAISGCWVDVCPRVQRGSVNLESFFRCTEGVAQDGKSGFSYYQNLAVLRTNASFGARAQIANGGSLFLISGMTNRNQKVVAVIISPSIKPGRGR